MTNKSSSQYAIIIPNWNGEMFLNDCVDSTLKQSTDCTVIVVDNGSTDNSRNIIESYGDKIISILLEKNFGFTGGVNKGLEYAINNGFDGAALLNNDAVVDQNWLKHLIENLDDKIGITTSLILSQDGKKIDTTGEEMTTWGLPNPRGRGKSASSAAKDSEFVFGASGGASLYSVPMLKEIGLFDQDFFAYYEDVDISFRAQLAGWKVLFVPSAKVYHRIGATSSRIKGFTTYHTFKNMRLLVIKNTPRGLRHIIYPRFYIAYSIFQIKALFSRNVFAMLRGSWAGILLTPKKMRERKAIMAKKVVTDEYIDSLLTHDLPENSSKLRAMRSLWWKLTNKR